MKRPLIITMGDPTGVGPELIIKALLTGVFDALPRPLVVAGDVAVLFRAARLFGISARPAIAGSDSLASQRLALGDRQLAVRPLSTLDA